MAARTVSAASERGIDIRIWMGSKRCVIIYSKNPPAQQNMPRHLPLKREARYNCPLAREVQLLRNTKQKFVAAAALQNVHASVLLAYG